MRLLLNRHQPSWSKRRQHPSLCRHLRPSLSTWPHNRLRNSLRLLTAKRFSSKNRPRMRVAAWTCWGTWPGNWLLRWKEWQIRRALLRHCLQPLPLPPHRLPPPLLTARSKLSGLLAEMEEPAEAAAAAAKDDPETHYNLGVAFREMGLLDEAIGEFQKVVKGAGKGKYPSNFLQACSLLAICFMEKKMPAIAVKWYMRALETPGLDDEAAMALQYDLGLAYEQAGDSRNALERFTEVYSQNIDFRDVADKIRELQQKA